MSTQLPGTAEPDQAQPVGLGEYLGLGLLLLLHTVLFVVLNGNFDHDYDAQQYGRIARELAHGEYTLTPHPFSQRFAVTVPTAVLFRLWGVNWLSATIWPLLCSLVTIACVHLALQRSFGRRTALAAACLLATNLIQVRFATRLLPDVVVSAFMLAAALLIERGRSGPQARQVRAGLFAALALLGALLAKATVVWCGPFFLGLLLFDLIRGRNRRLWISFLVGVSLCAAAFLLAYGALTGDIFYRLNGIEGVHNARAGFFAGGLGQFAYRLTSDPLIYLLERPGFGLALLLALPALVFAARAPRSETASARYWSSYLICVVGSFWFGTTSLREYTPLYLSDRFLMPFLAPLAILGGIAITRVLDASIRPRRSRLELAPFLLGSLATAALFLTDWLQMAGFYAGIAFLGALVARSSRAARGASTMLVLLAMAVPVADYAWRSDPTETSELLQLERSLIAETFPLEGPPVLILADRHSAFVLPFYIPRKARDQVRIQAWDNPLSAVRAGERVLVYIHQPRLVAVNLNWGQALPDFAFEIPATWPHLNEKSLDGKHWILLCEVDDPRSVLGGR